MKVKYTGTSDVQIFDAADFKKADLEGKKTAFHRDQPVEVSDEIGAALTSNEGLFGPYSFEQVEDNAEAPSEDENSSDAGLVEDEPPADGKAATTEGTADASVATSPGRSTGRGSSTRSR